MIHYLIGDATEPITDKYRIVCHVVNDEGRWGRGFVVAVSQKWPKAETSYKAHSPMPLGTTDLVYIDSNTIIASMCAQHSVYKADINELPLRYDALELCLQQIAKIFSGSTWSIHMPRIGCGLARGKWDKVEAIINESLKNMDVYVYDLQ